jgi:hypothetical protein
LPIVPALFAQGATAIAKEPAMSVRGEDKPALAVVLALDAHEWRNDDGATLLSLWRLARRLRS